MVKTLNIGQSAAESPERRSVQRLSLTGVQIMVIHYLEIPKLLCIFHLVKEINLHNKRYSLIP